MALGRSGRPRRFGRPRGRLTVGVWLGFICLALTVPAASGAEPADFIKSFGPDGTAATEFEKPAKVAVDQGTGDLYVSDRGKQVIYKFNEEGSPLNFGGIESYISGNELTGLEFDPLSPVLGQIAVDSETHVLYATSGNKVRAFEADGEPHQFSTGPGEGGSEIPGATTLAGVAVDSLGNIYASDVAAEKVRIYSRSGALITEFEPVGNLLSPLRPSNLAVSDAGTLYIADRDHPVYAFTPSKFPVTPETTYGLGQPLDSYFSYSVGVDPNTSFAYVPEFPPSRVGIYDDEGEFLGSLGGPGQPGEIKGSPVGVGINGQTARAYVTVHVESGAEPSQVSVYDGFSFVVDKPTLLNVAATEVRSTSATLRAKINPNTLDTAYWFEYGPADCSVEVGTCTKIPSDEENLGSGHKPVLVAEQIMGLMPGTRYYYRLIAKNSIGIRESAIRSFVTPTNQFGSLLGDERIWEQVTPANKFGGAITNAGLLQADPDGSGIAFQTRGSIVEDPESNRALEPSAVLARRTGPAAWGVADLVPTHTEAGGAGFGPPFKLFSSDLGQALFEPRDSTPHSPEASERSPYLRTNTMPPSFRPLVTSKEGFANVPPGTIFGGEVNGDRNPVSVVGANPTLTHVLLSSQPALVAGAAERGLYLWHDGALEPVSELPVGEGGGVVSAQPGSGTISVRHAISEDGSRVFWGPGDPLGPSLAWPALYLRDTVTDETDRIDVPESGASGPGAAHPTFMNASADGSVVFFTDSQQLTEGASPEGRDLYRCEIGDVGGSLGCVDIVDLSAPLSGSGENGEARELSLGMSDDGGTIYFVARGILDLGPNEAGESAVSGAPNLYVWQEGQGVRFVARLAEEDGPNWGKSPAGELGHSSRVAASSSPSGRYLVFMSQENLTGAESDDPETGEPVEQAFRYDAAEDELLCISCNPNGGTDAGHLVAKDVSEGGVILPDPQQLWGGRWVGATLPEPSEGEPTAGYALYSPRAVLDNGRAYFNSVAPLVTGDSNGTWDVYQFEPDGTGTCDPSAASGMVAVSESGCVGLISSGTDNLPSVFMDASESGDDVFFATFARLSALDTDTIVDIYDARVGGVEASVEEPTECAGQACHPSGTPPSDSTPGSATFNGASSVKHHSQKHCKKGQRRVRKKGKVKCVPRNKSGKHGKKGGGR